MIIKHSILTFDPIIVQTACPLALVPLGHGVYQRLGLVQPPLPQQPARALRDEPGGVQQGDHAGNALNKCYPILKLRILTMYESQTC